MVDYEVLRIGLFIKIIIDLIRIVWCNYFKVLECIWIFEVFKGMFTNERGRKIFYEF